MGIGNSQERYVPKLRRRSTSPKPGRHGARRRRRGLSRKVRPIPGHQPVIPARYSSPRQYSYGPSPFASQPYFFEPPPPIYMAPMPPSYNNYIAPSYIPQQQPLVMPQQIPQSHPMMMPQQVSPYMFSPYMSSPYSQGLPLSAPYVQEQPEVQAVYNNVGVSAPMPTVYLQQPIQMQPMYNNIGASAPISTGMTARLRQYSMQNQALPIRVVTDWTGGGKISPGFLGPPI